MSFKRFGRKKVFLISKLAEFVIYFVIGMTQSFGSYVLLRWLEGVFVYLPYTTAFVLGLLLNSFWLTILCVVTCMIQLYCYFCFWVSFLLLFYLKMSFVQLIKEWNILGKDCETSVIYFYTLFTFFLLFAFKIWITFKVT